MNVCPGEGMAYDSYYNETDRVTIDIVSSFIKERGYLSIFHLDPVIDSHIRKCYSM